MLIETSNSFPSGKKERNTKNLILEILWILCQTLSCKWTPLPECPDNLITNNNWGLSWKLNHNVRNQPLISLNQFSLDYWVTSVNCCRRRSRKWAEWLTHSSQLNLNFEKVAGTIIKSCISFLGADPLEEFSYRKIVCGEFSIFFSFH